MDRLDGDLTPEQMKQIRFIENSARDLQELVNDLLDLAKVEAGKIRIRPKQFQVHELFSALKGMLKPLLADNTSVELIFEDASELPVLHTDEGKVSQILRNLISNALKFTPAGHVRVAARMPGPDLVLFSVEDTGIGIAPEHHENIFREFSQVDNPLQERHRGTGLGLPLCRNLAMLLGGRIWLESEPGEGSKFYAAIPAVYVGEAAQLEDAANLPAPNSIAPRFCSSKTTLRRRASSKAVCAIRSSRRSWLPPQPRPRLGSSGTRPRRSSPISIWAKIPRGNS